jgi:hypothetical protein
MEIGGLPEGVCGGKKRGRKKDNAETQSARSQRRERAENGEKKIEEEKEGNE